MSKPRHYSEDLRRGFVVRVSTKAPSGRTLNSWWYGPSHGWGTTSGDQLDYSVAVFPSRVAAERAWASVYGDRRPVVETVSDARGIIAARAKRLER